MVQLHIVQRSTIPHPHQGQNHTPCPVRRVATFRSFHNISYFTLSAVAIASYRSMILKFPLTPSNSVIFPVRDFASP